MTRRTVRFTSMQVVHDFNNSAIALRRYFGAGFTIHQVLDLQLAFEAVHGRIGADAVAVMRAFGQDASYSDASCRYHLLPLPFLLYLPRDGTAGSATPRVLLFLLLLLLLANRAASVRLVFSADPKPCERPTGTWHFPSCTGHKTPPSYVNRILRTLLSAVPRFCRFLSTHL